MKDERAEPYLAPIPEHARFASYHLVWPDGSYLSGGRAGIPVLQMLGAPLSWLGKLLGALRLTWLAVVVYALVSRNRGWLGRFVPDGPGPVRYP